MTSALRAFVRLVTYLLWTVFSVPIQLGLIVVAPRGAKQFPRFYHKICCRILGFRLRVTGRANRDVVTMFVCNHSSYLDIMILGGLIPACFVAKKEVASWPMFGVLARMQRTVFIARDRHAVGEHKDGLEDRVRAGDSLILFPEGTTSDGNRILPFKSSFFSLAENRQLDLAVQPVSVAYSALDGVPMGRDMRPFLAWYGDMGLLKHIWQVAGLGRVTVDVEFHPAVRGRDFASRKELSAYAEARVARGVSQALTGKPRPAVVLIPGGVAPAMVN